MEYTEKELVYIKTAYDIYFKDGCMSTMSYLDDLMRGKDVTESEYRKIRVALNELLGI